MPQLPTRATVQQWSKHQWRQAVECDEYTRQGMHTWNMVRRPAISSWDMPAAMTLRASFFSLFMAAKPRMRFRMTLSRGRSLAVPFSRIQSCCRMVLASALFLGSCLMAELAEVVLAFVKISYVRICEVQSSQAGHDSAQLAYSCQQKQCIVIVYRLVHVRQLFMHSAGPIKVLSDSPSNQLAGCLVLRCRRHQCLMPDLHREA